MEKHKHAKSEIGKDILRYQDKLAAEYKYKRLPDELAIDSMRKYVLTLPEGFHLSDNSIPVADNPEINSIMAVYTEKGFEIKKTPFPLVSRYETMISCSFNRIVIGHYGAFIEIDDEDIYRENIKCEDGQEWRIKDRRYKDKVKYHWFTTKDNSICKLYYQTRKVIYADYIPGKWYISPFEVLDRNELIEVLTKGEGNNE
jgi:hypothetical protein